MDRPCSYAHLVHKNISEYAMKKQEELLKSDSRYAVRSSIMVVPQRVVRRIKAGMAVVLRPDIQCGIIIARKVCRWHSKALM